MTTNLNKVSSVISLEKTENFSISRHFKKGKGFGNFYLIDDRIKNFTETIHVSCSLEIAPYELIASNVSEDSVINDATDQKIYTEMDMAHVWQIFYRYICGEDLMSGDGVSGFLVRNKNGVLCTVNIYWIENEGWYLSIVLGYKKQSSSDRYFFLHMPTITG